MSTPIIGGSSGSTPYPGTIIQPPFAAGEGWTLIQPSPPSEGTSSFAGGGAGRVTLSSTGALHGLSGPRIERAIPGGIGVFLASARLLSAVSPIHFGMYLRDAVTSRSVMMLYNGNPAFDGALATMFPEWNITSVSAPGIVTADGTCALGIRYVRGTSVGLGFWNASQEWTAGAFIGMDGIYPTHVGVAAWADGAWNGHADFGDFVLETFG